MIWLFVDLWSLIVDVEEFFWFLIVIGSKYFKISINFFYFVKKFFIRYLIIWREFEVVLFFYFFVFFVVIMFCNFFFFGNDFEDIMWGKIFFGVVGFGSIE